MDKIERLFNAINGSKDVYHKWRVAFSNPPLNEETLTYSNGPYIVWGNYEILAIKSLFVEKDLITTKQHYYTCGRLDVFLIEKYDDKLLDYGINHLSYALLSDNQGLITRYANLRHSNYEKAIMGGGTTPMYVLQCLIKEDWAEYERAIEIMRAKTLKKWPIMHLDLSFYEALASKDKIKMEEVLAELVSPKVHRQRNKHHILLNEFISHPALGYAKLACIKGVEVEVNSPLVPKELLPIRPLDNYYDEYEFLKQL